jgi:hypothetical protein
MNAASVDSRLPRESRPVTQRPAPAATRRSLARMRLRRCDATVALGRCPGRRPLKTGRLQMAELRRLRKRDADLYIAGPFVRRVDAVAHGSNPEGLAGCATVTARRAGDVRITVWRAGRGAGALAATLHAVAVCGGVESSDVAGEPSTRRTQSDRRETWRVMGAAARVFVDGGKLLTGSPQQAEGSAES